jgi:hypothetical protein
MDLRGGLERMQGQLKALLSRGDHAAALHSIPNRRMNEHSCGANLGGHRVEVDRLAVPIKPGRSLAED